MKTVAIEESEEIQTSDGHAQEDVDQTGRWQFLSKQESFSQQIKVDGCRVLIGISATWQYIGGSVNGNSLPPVPAITDQADLRGKETAITDSMSALLTEGDHATGARDPANKISIGAQKGGLRTE